MKILLIDDERSIARTLSVALETNGHETIAVGSSAGALRQMQRTSFDIAFLDLRLGREDGLQVLAQLRRADSALAVVIITAVGTGGTNLRTTMNKAANAAAGKS